MNDHYEQGLSTRRAVLGDDYVDQALGRSSEFRKPLEELVTTYCWGAVWSRPGLARTTRSMLNIAMLSVLDRQRELHLHVRAALGNGCTVSEIQEAILQVAVYGGVPAALEAARTAEDAIAEWTAAQAAAETDAKAGERG